MKLKWRSLAALFSVVGVWTPGGLAQAQPAPVDEYPIHADGGIIYDPLRREAASTGQLTRYQQASTTPRTVTLGPLEARFAVPDKAAAYDVVPIRYELSWRTDKGNPPVTFPVAIEAVAFEDQSRRKQGELRKLTRMAVQQGIIPSYLPQFDNMRDMAINERYGTDYQVHYNLPQPRKGYMMHCLVAVYPWFQATYEEGGIPGIIWEDYQCDGFATETQKREMRLFAKRLGEAISTPEALAARAKDVQTSSQEWRKGSRALPSYLPPRK